MGEDPNRIREEIEQTRAQMGGTVDALGYKADGKSRAKTEFARRSVGLDKLNSKVRYSSHATGESTCTVYTLKRNAVVVLAIPVTGNGAGSPDQFKTACKQIAKQQVPKLVDAALT